MSISILLVDDHNLFRSGVRQLLQREEDLCIVAEAVDGLEGLKRVKALRPDEARAFISEGRQQHCREKTGAGYPRQRPLFCAYSLFRTIRRHPR